METTLETPVSLTPVAAEKVIQLAKSEECEPALRLAVIGGGCSGFQYQIGFDDATEEDIKVESEGVTILVDPFSLPYLKGTNIDFLDTLQDAGFKINNPNATGGCGCGQSFTAEDAEAVDAARDSGLDSCQGCG
jgi:iron-sulfur cluster assembly accessory protein